MLYTTINIFTVFGKLKENDIILHKSEWGNSKAEMDARNTEATCREVRNTFSVFCQFCLKIQNFCFL